MTRTCTLAVMACLLAASASQALSIVLLPMPVRVAAADVVFVGKVISVTEKPVPAGKGDARQMKIATLKVSETLMGRAAREVKVAFYLLPPSDPKAPMIAGIEILYPQLSKDQEGLLVLQKHPTMKGVYLLSGYPGLIPSKGNPGYAKDHKEAKEAARLLADPMKGLKSRDAGERAATATLLVTRYKMPPGPAAKTESVPAAESKMILEALAEGDWDPKAGHERLTSSMAFSRLRLTAADGWKQPDNAGGDFSADARKWLRDNAGKYKMTRYVREKDAPSEEPDGPAK